MSRGAGAGREHSQAAAPRWPVEIFHSIDVMLSLSMGIGWGAEGRNPLSFLGATPVTNYTCN